MSERPMLPTADQTVGPFFRDGLAFDGDNLLVEPGTAGTIVLAGRVLDGEGQPVPDALIEIWQADSTGQIVSEPGSRNRRSGRFTGFGRCETDPDGCYEFVTWQPGAVAPSPAAYFAVKVFARGLLAVLDTRIYIPGDDEALAVDPLLARLTPVQRETLIAVRAAPDRLQHDIRLQGERETVFLAFR